VTLLDAPRLHALRLDGASLRPKPQGPMDSRARSL